MASTGVRSYPAQVCSPTTPAERNKQLSSKDGNGICKSRFGLAIACFSISLTPDPSSLTKRRIWSDFSLEFGFGNLSFNNLLLPPSLSRFYYAGSCLEIKVQKPRPRMLSMVVIHGSEGDRRVCHIGDDWWVEYMAVFGEMRMISPGLEECGKRNSRFRI